MNQRFVKIYLDEGKKNFCDADSEIKINRYFKN